MEEQVGIFGDAVGAVVDVADHAGGAVLGTAVAGPVGGIYGATHGVSGLAEKGQTAISNVQDYASATTGGQGDVERAWGQSQPAWANELIEMCVSLNKWPEASENALWQLRDSYSQMAKMLSEGAEGLSSAKGGILAGWDAPAAESFDGWTQGNQVELAAAAGNAGSLAEKAGSFGTETQYTKLAINVAFWATLAEVFAAVCAAFFTFGLSLGAGAAAIAALRVVITALAARLATSAGRAVAMTSAKAAAKKAGAVAVKTAPKAGAIGAGTAVAKDGAVQGLQNARGTRDGYDGGKAAGSAAGGLTGGAVGGGIGGPLASKFPASGSKIPPFSNIPQNSQVVNGTPRYVTPPWNRPINSAVTNAVAGPAGVAVGGGVATPLDDVDNSMQGPAWKNPYTIENIGAGLLRQPVAVGGAVAGATP